MLQVNYHEFCIIIILKVQCLESDKTCNSNEVATTSTGGILSLAAFGFYNIGSGKLLPLPSF